MRCMRRSSTAAVKMITATLASSEGWTPTPPMANHRCVPLISGPTTNTAASPRAEAPSALQITTGSLR